MSDQNRKQQTDEQIEKSFVYYHPSAEQQRRYERLADSAKTLALEIQDLCPESRERSLALTNLQQAILWGNSAISIHATGATQAAGR